VDAISGVALGALISILAEERAAGEATATEGRTDGQPGTDDARSLVASMGTAAAPLFVALAAGILREHSFFFITIACRSLSWDDHILCY
jgi:hypothetical protein